LARQASVKNDAANIRSKALAKFTLLSAWFRMGLMSSELPVIGTTGGGKDHETRENSQIDFVGARIGNRGR
jgi:hypothetical protein